MPKPTQSNINDFAFDYLCTHYATSYSAKNILARKDERTKKGATANGLFALKTTDETPFVAALNTQNSAKMARLLTRHKKQGLSKLRFITPVVLLAVGLYLVNLLRYEAVFFVLPVVVALAGFVVHTLLEKAYLTHRLTQLVDCLNQTPANELWLGISISSTSLKHNALAKHLVSACQQRGIGILTVGKRAKVVQIQAPQAAACRRSDFLAYYVAGNDLRQELSDNTKVHKA